MPDLINDPNLASELDSLASPVEDPNLASELDSLVKPATPEPAPANPVSAARDELKSRLKDMRMLPAFTSAATSAWDKELVKENGVWKTPMLGITPDKDAGMLESLGLGMSAAVQGGLSKFFGAQTGSLDSEIKRLQQVHGLDDSQMQSAWSDLINEYRTWEPDEKTRVLSDGTISLNPASRELLDTPAIEKIIDESGAPDQAKAAAKQNLPNLQSNAAQAKLEGYEAAATALKSPGGRAALLPFGVGGQAISATIEAPSEYAKRTGRKDINTAAFMRDYERDVAQGNPIMDFARGIATDWILGANNVAVQTLGNAGMLGSEKAGAIAAAGQEAANAITAGKPDTGITGQVVQQVLPIGAMMVATQLTGAAAALTGSEKVLGVVNSLSPVIYSGAQSAGAQYAQSRAEGKDHTAAQSDAAKAGATTALITGMFSAAGLGGVEDIAAGKQLAGVTIGDLLKSKGREEVVKNAKSFAGKLAKGFMEEAPEEGLDQLVSAFVNADPETNLSDAWQQAWDAGMVDGIMGTGTAAFTGNPEAAKTAIEIAPDLPDTAKALVEVTSAPKPFTVSDIPKVESNLPPLTSTNAPETPTEKVVPEGVPEAGNVPTPSGSGVATPEPVAPVEAAPAAPESVTPVKAGESIPAIHYSRTPMKLQKGADLENVPGKYEEKSILGNGFYAMEPQDENLWTQEVQRFEVGPNRNEVSITPQKPFVITPQNLGEVSVEGIKADLASGKYDAVVIRGFDPNNDASEAIRNRVEELWSPKFPEGKTEGRFINGDEYDAALEQATQEVLGISAAKFEEVHSAGLDMNQIFVPADTAPDIVTQTTLAAETPQPQTPTPQTDGQNERQRQGQGRQELLTPATEAPPVSAGGAVVAISDQPSENLPPRSTETVEPRPERQGRDTSARDAWDEKYGTLVRGGRTHNDDGSPYQPTVFDETVPKIVDALNNKTFDEKLDAVGTDTGAELGTGIRQLLNDGWAWSEAQQRMVDPQNRGETPRQALNRIRTKQQTPTTNENQVQETGGTPPVESVPTQPAAAGETETGTALGSGQGQETVTPTPRDPKVAKEFESDLKMSGVAYDGDTRYSVQQSSDGTFRAERSANGVREDIEFGLPDIESAQKVILDDFNGVVKPTAEAPEDTTPAQPETAKPVEEKPTLRFDKSLLKSPTGSPENQMKLAARASRISVLLRLNDVTETYDPSDLAMIPNDQIDEIQDYLIKEHRRILTPSQVTPREKLLTELGTPKNPGFPDKVITPEGVAVELTQDGAKIKVSIETPQEIRNTGKATAAMTRLVDLARRDGVTLDLDVVPMKDQPVSAEKLTSWYAKLGFTDNGDGTMTFSPETTKPAAEKKPATTKPPIPHSVEALKTVLGYSDEVAIITDALAKARGIDLSRVVYRRGGKPGSEAGSAALSQSENQFNNEVRTYVTGNWSADPEERRAELQRFAESWVERYRGATEDSGLRGIGVGISTDSIRGDNDGTTGQSVTSVTPSGEVVIRIGSQVIDSMVGSGDEFAAKVRVAKDIQEEVFHAANIVAIMRRVGNNENVAARDVVQTYRDILGSIKNPTDEARVSEALRSSYTIYNNLDLAGMGLDPRGMSAAMLERTLPLGVKTNLVGELIRQVVQLHRSSDISETSYENAIEAATPWLQDSVAVLQEVARGNTDLGPLLARDIAETNAILDEASILYQRSPDTARFEELTSSIPANPTQADLDAWKATHPENLEIFDSVRSKASDLLGLRKPSEMEFGVTRRIEDSQILDPIVQAIPVDVVDMLGGKQRASYVLLHNPSVFEDALPINRDVMPSDPRSAFSQAIASVVAGIRAELGFSLNHALLDREMFSALDALQHNLITMGGRTLLDSTSGRDSFDKGFPVTRDTRFTGSDETLSGAESPSAVLDLVRGYEKVDSANFARSLNRHAKDVADYPGVSQGVITPDQWGDTGNPSILYQFAGENANVPQFMRDSLDTAKAMAAAGKPSEEIRAVTGWFPGKYDGKMRWEIPDNGATWNQIIAAPPYPIELKEVLKHPSLYEAYPDVANLRVAFDGTLPKNVGGHFNPRTGLLTLNNQNSDAEKLSSTLHEVQHWIQEKEGFGKGTSPTEEAYSREFALTPDQQATVDGLKSRREELLTEKREVDNYLRSVEAKDRFSAETRAKSDRRDAIDDELHKNYSQEARLTNKARDDFGFSRYNRTAGEIEARDIQARANLTPEQLAATAPYSSENIAPEAAIVLNQRGKGMQASVEFLADGKSLIRAYATGNPTSALHEHQHIFDKTIMDSDSPEAVATRERLGITDDMRQEYHDTSGFTAWRKMDAEARTDKQRKAAAKAWEKTMEKRARWFERYFYDGIAPKQTLAPLFEKIAGWFRSVYGAVVEATPIAPVVPDSIRKVFDQMFQNLPPLHEILANTPPEPLVPEIPPVEFVEPEPLPPGRASHAMSDQERANLGMTPRIPTPTITDADVWATAQATEDAHRAAGKPGTAGTDLMHSKLANMDFTLSTKEQALIIHEIVTRRNTLTAAQRTLTSLPKNAPDLTKSEAQKAVTEAQEKYQEVLDFNDAIGSEEGRAFRLRRWIIALDYSYEGLSRRFHTAANAHTTGNNLTRQEIAAAADYAAKLEQAQARYDALVASTDEKLAESARIIEELTADVERAQKRDSATKSKVRKAVTDRAAEAKKRLQERGVTFLAQAQDIDAQTLKDFAAVAAEWLVDKPLTIAEFTQKLTTTFGTWISDHAERIFKTAKQTYNETAASVTGKSAPSPEQVIAEIEQSDAEEPTRKEVWQLARAYVIAGLRGENVLDETHAALSELFNGLSRDRVAEIFTDYGITQHPKDKSKIAQELGRIKILERIALQVTDLKAGRLPKVTGFLRDPEIRNAEIRRLEREFRRLYKEEVEAGNIPDSGAEGRAKSALASAKTRMSNEIKELQDAIDRNRAMAAKKSSLKLDDEALELRTKLEAKRNEYEEAFPAEGLTDEKRREILIRNLDRQIAQETQMLADGILKKVKTAPVADTPEIAERRRKLAALRKERRDLYDAANPLREAKANARSAIERLTAIIEKGRIDIKEGKQVNPDDELRALIETREALSDEVDELRRASYDYGTRQITNALRSAEASLHKLSERLATGNLSVPAKTVTPASRDAAVQAIRARVKELNADLDARRREEKVGPYSDEARLTRELASLAKRKAELERRIREKDVSRKAKNMPLEDARKRRAQYEIELLKAEFSQMEERLVMKNAPLTKKAQYYGIGAANLLKIVTLGFDVGVVLRQLGTTYQALVSDLSVFSKNGDARKNGSHLARLIKTGVRAFADPAVENEIYEQVKNRPGAEYDNVGSKKIYFSPPFDTFSSTKEDIPRADLMKDIPWFVWPAIAGVKWFVFGMSPPAGVALVAVGALTKPLLTRLDRAQRAMTNVSRADFVDAARRAATAEGAIALKPADYSVMNNAVMVATGRGQIKKLDPAIPVANVVLLATRFYLSRIMALSLQPLFAEGIFTPKESRAGMRARTEVAKMYARSIAGRASLYALLWAMLGRSDDEKEKKGTGLILNPFSNDFGRYRVNENLKVDFMSGINSFASITARYLGRRRYDATTGKYTALGGGFRNNVNEEASRFLSSKMNLLTKFIIDTNAGQYFGGKPVTVATAFEQASTAIITNDVVRVYEEMIGTYGKEEGAAKATAICLLMFGGMGASVRPSADEQRALKAMQKEIAKDEARRTRELNE